MISPDCVFDASLVPETCLDRFVDLKGLINKFLESRQTGHPVLELQMDDFGVNQDLRFGFRLAVVSGIWLMPTPMPPRTFGGYFPRAFSAAAFVLNGLEILSG